MRTYENPILPGFHPDPSILRVGEDYYLANSTFQWWPGILLSHSRDLVHWETLGHVLTRPRQLDLRGVDDSMGVWAPTLRRFDGTFYVIASMMRQYRDGDRTKVATENRLYTAPDIAGPWDDGTYIHDVGIDPDIFQDTDGRLYITSQDMVTPGGPRQERISIQEYDPRERCLVGRRRVIWDGTELGTTEGPHLYHRDGWYYLLTAEGGTFFGHAVSLCRSRSLFGPYELAPHNPVLTMRGRDETLARAGHADLVETQDGAWWLVCLGGRPNANRRCILGRETFLLPVHWTEDGWPVVNEGRGLEERLGAPDLPEWRPGPAGHGYAGFDGFDGPELAPCWQAVRSFEPDHLRLEDGALRLRARPQPLDDIGAVNVIGRRQQHRAFAAETDLSFAPDTDGERAGIVCYYDRWHYIAFTLGYQDGLVLEVKRRDGDEVTVTRVPYDRTTARLRVEADGEDYRFSLVRWDPVTEAPEPVPVGPVQDGGHLSDEEAGVLFPWAAFTGAFVCLFATGGGSHSDKWASFGSFEYWAQ